MADLTATDAVLAAAAAQTEAEMHAARIALIETGGDVLRGLDYGSLVSGDGTAGRRLLGGTGSPLADSTAMRSTRLQVRLLAQLARPEASHA